MTKNTAFAFTIITLVAMVGWGQNIQAQADKRDLRAQLSNTTSISILNGGHHDQ